MTKCLMERINLRYLCKTVPQLGGLSGLSPLEKMFSRE